MLKVRWIINRHVVKTSELTRIKTLRTPPIQLSIIGVLAAFAPILTLACFLSLNWLYTLLLNKPLIITVPRYLSALLVAVKFPWVLLTAGVGASFALSYQWSVRNNRWWILLDPDTIKPILLGLDSIIALLLNLILWGILMLSGYAPAAMVLWGADGIAMILGGFIFNVIWHAFFDPLIRLLGHITLDDLIKIEKHCATYH